MLLIEQRPLGLGHVSIAYNTLKSARLKTKTFVYNTTMHLSVFMRTAFTSDLQLVSTIHFSRAILSKKIQSSQIMSLFLGYLGVLPPPTNAKMFVLCTISTIPIPAPN